MILYTTVPFRSPISYDTNDLFFLPFQNGEKATPTAETVAPTERNRFIAKQALKDIDVFPRRVCFGYGAVS